MTYRIVHHTRYEYSSPVSVSHHAAMVEPRHTGHQHREEFWLVIRPEPAVCKVRTDYFGNRVCLFSIQERHAALELEATSVVTTAAVTPSAPALSPDWEDVVELFRDPVSPEVVEPYQYCFDSPLIRASRELAGYCRESFRPGTPLLVAVTDLSRRIFTDFKYDPVATTVATPLEAVWENRRGVCQDFAHLAIACLRSVGVPARYVSGYIRTHPPEGRPRRIGADASHAWFSTFCPRFGWVDFDPTNNLMPSGEHVTVACGRDYSDVSPVSGILTGGGSHEIQVSVDMAPMVEAAGEGRV
ncbi:MAG: transglutaminase family protein [Verrucomicrobiae bacterium]|nr:transglutaminase family protein [Verrucomicrobiae bacterium]